MDLKIVDSQGAASALHTANDAVFGRNFNEALIHQVVVAYQANARSANSKQKDREEVNHSTKKPFKQKGTGRARAGMTSSPLWRGGGRIFPNSPDENFSQKINRKMHKAGMASIYSQLVRENRLLVVDAFQIDAPKTRLVANKLKAMGLSGSTLILIDAPDEKLSLASRNLPGLLVLEAHQVDPVSLVRFSQVVLTKAAVAKVEEILL